MGIHTNTSVVFPNPGIVSAGTQTPQTAPLSHPFYNTQGWYFKNTTANQKIHWYLPPQKSNTTVSDIKGIYFSMFNGLTTAKGNAPFLVIYTKPPSPNPNPTFYTSRRVYIFSQNPTSNTYYTAYFNRPNNTLPEPVNYYNTLMPLVETNISSSTDGPFGDNEEILGFAISSNSGSDVNTAEFVIQKFGVMTQNTSQEFIFMFPQVINKATSTTNLTPVSLYLDASSNNLFYYIPPV